MLSLARPSVLTRQQQWRYLMLFAFFLGGVGAGTYFLSYIFQFRLGLILGLLIVGVGKGACHIIYLGRPLRAWRILLRPHSSWLSRGLIGVLLFLVTGGLYAAGPQVIGNGPAAVIGIASLVTAVWVMIYTGFLMARSPSIPFWNTALLPVMFTLYGFVGGMDVVLISVGFAGDKYLTATEAQLARLELLLLGLALVFLGIYVGSMYTSSALTKTAARLWLKGDLALPFWLGMIGIGLLIPLALVLLNTLAGVGSPALIAIVGFFALAGGAMFRWGVLRAGVYRPLL